MALHLRFRLQSGTHAVPLRSVYRVAGFAALDGEPQDYFLGWLRFHGKFTPVFDLNQVICEMPTLETFGSRIMVLEAGPDAPVSYIGLLAAGVTDTISADDPAANPLDLTSYLQMLYALIPDLPGEQT
ncbi:MAG TPA: chemotaxis protein CheW [Terracidiphilus sp.]|jgi:chemotaxis signal transduction protein|nr:chemotaxis protein CheW [Terracidiphilus sp.]